MFDIVGIGECVVDMTPAGESEKGNALLNASQAAHPAICLLVQLSKASKRP